MQDKSSNMTDDCATGLTAFRFWSWPVELRLGEANVTWVWRSKGRMNKDYINILHFVYGGDVVKGS